MPELIYEPIGPIDREAIETAIRQNDPTEMSVIVLSIALHDPDPEFSEQFCLRFVNHEHFNVRGNAILGFAHIARIHNKLDENKVKPIIRGALLDENEFVRGQASNAKDDTEWYLKWKY